MKKKKLLLMILSALVITLLPKTAFAKTLEVNFPSNEMTWGEYMQSYTVRTEGFRALGVSPYGNFIVSPCSGADIIEYQLTGTTLKFTLLDGVTNDDLQCAISQDMRDANVNNYGEDIYEGYDDVLLSVKELSVPQRDEAVFDFTKLEDQAEMTAYEKEAWANLSVAMTNPNSSYPLLVSEVIATSQNPGDDNYSEILTKDGSRSLVKLHYKESSTPNKIIVTDGKFEDNVSFDLENTTVEDFAAWGVDLKKVSFIFGEETNNPQTDPTTPTNPEKPADNNIKNPLTFNNSLLIVLVLGTVGATSIVVFGKRKKQKSL